SIRDIMQEGRKPARVEESVDLVRNFFDLVLVHGDPELVAIGETLQGSEIFNSKIRYTGLVVPEINPTPRAIPALDAKPDVIVSVGGGAFGQRLLFAALEAMPLCKSFPRNWLVTTGTEMAEKDYLKICQRAPEGMTIVRHIPDMVSALSACQVSVSHSGYNTVGDILQAGCRSVLFPYVDGNETEQLRRAQMMARLGIARCIEPDEFSPASLAMHIDAAAEMEPESLGIDLEGASKTPQILLAELNTRH
ncbi:MAG: glycosyltransferase, partial [Pseudomonadota bacterium]